LLRINPGHATPLNQVSTRPHREDQRQSDGLARCIPYLDLGCQTSWVRILARGEAITNDIPELSRTNPNSRGIWGGLSTRFPEFQAVMQRVRRVPVVTLSSNTSEFSRQIRLVIATRKLDDLSDNSCDSES
jgi:hypothetical protein